MPRIFISYSRRDTDFARQLAASLQGTGLDVWIDLDDIHAGSKWGEAIQEGLDDSQAMIVILSPDSMASENVRDEWQYFIDHKKPIIPVLLKPTRIHFQLNRIQYIDFQQQPYEAAFATLCNQLEHRLGMATLRVDNRNRQPVAASSTTIPPGNARQSRGRMELLPVLILSVGMLVLVVSIFLAVRPLLPGNATATPTITHTADVTSPPMTPDLPAGGQGAGSATGQPAVLPLSDFEVIVTIPFAYLRSGPGAQFDSLATGLQGETFPVIGEAPGFNAEGNSIAWYMIRHTTGRDLWISSEIVELVNPADATEADVLQLTAEAVPQLTMTVPQLTANAPAVTRTPPVPPTIPGGGGSE